jgi:hypothetical protein
MMDFLSEVGWGRIQQIKRPRTQITCLRASKPLSEPGSIPEFRLNKEQGRRRSITLTALPAPDIEIGLRHPVNTDCSVNLRTDVIYFTVGKKNAAHHSVGLPATFIPRV